MGAKTATRLQRRPPEKHANPTWLKQSNMRRPRPETNIRFSATGAPKITRCGQGPHFDDFGKRSCLSCFLMDFGTQSNPLTPVKSILPQAPDKSTFPKRELYIPTTLSRSSAPGCLAPFLFQGRRVWRSPPGTKRARRRPTNLQAPKASAQPRLF